MNLQKNITTNNSTAQKLISTKAPEISHTFIHWYHLRSLYKSPYLPDGTENTHFSEKFNTFKYKEWKEKTGALKRKPVRKSHLALCPTFLSIYTMQGLYLHILGPVGRWSLWTIWIVTEVNRVWNYIYCRPASNFCGGRLRLMKKNRGNNSFYISFVYFPHILILNIPAT